MDNARLSIVLICARKRLGDMFADNFFASRIACPITELRHGSVLQTLTVTVNAPRLSSSERFPHVNQTRVRKRQFVFSIER